MRLIDSSGTALADRTLEITPTTAYPDGPECGGGTPQTGLTVAADGTVSQRR